MGNLNSLVEENVVAEQTIFNVEWPKKSEATILFF